MVPVHTLIRTHTNIHTRDTPNTLKNFGLITINPNILKMYAGNIGGQSFLVLVFEFTNKIIFGAGNAELQFIMQTFIMHMGNANLINLLRLKVYDVIIPQQTKYSTRY